MCISVFRKRIMQKVNSKVESKPPEHIIKTEEEKDRSKNNITLFANYTEITYISGYIYIYIYILGIRSYWVLKKFLFPI